MAPSAMPTDTSLSDRYDSASGLWADKMRILGYYDGYLGFLSHWPGRAATPATLLDVGAGTGAMAEAWIAVHGAPPTVTLLDPSASMLNRAAGALKRRGVAPRLEISGLEDTSLSPHDVVLAAHVIEHFPDPAEALARIAALTAPGGELWLVVSKPHWCNAIIWLQWRHRTYRPARVQELLEAAGFVLEDTYAFPAGPPSRTSTGYLARRL